MNKLATEYNKIIKAYKDLDIDQKLPTLAEIEAAITPKQKKLITKEKAQLVISPEIKSNDEFDNLLNKIEHWKYADLWDQYDLTAPMKVSFVVPKAYYLNQALDEQRESLKEEKILDCITPIESLMWEILYKPKVLRDYWLRLISLPNKTVGGGSVVGSVHSHGDRLRLSGSAGGAYSSVGVGLSVGLNLNLSTSVLPESFSLSDLQENTAAIRELTEVIRKVYNVQ